jgi:hypothetical protein
LVECPPLPPTPLCGVLPTISVIEKEELFSANKTSIKGKSPLFLLVFGQKENIFNELCKIETENRTSAFAISLSLSFSFFAVGGVRPFFYCFCAAKAKVISIETNFVALSLDEVIIRIWMSGKTRFKI